MEIEKKNDMKCQLKLIFIFFGFSFIIMPHFYKLLINFPEENNISKWINKYRYVFFIISLIPDIILLLISYESFYDVKVKEINGNNFEYCEIKSKSLHFLMIFFSLIKFFILSAMIILIYIEWSIESTFDDMRPLALNIYTNLFVLTLYTILHYIDFKNYIVFFNFNVLFNIIISVFNYLSLFGIRILWFIKKKTRNHTEFIKKINKDFINKSHSKVNTRNASSTGVNSSKSITNGHEHYNNNTKLKTVRIELVSRKGDQRDECGTISQYVPQILVKAYNYHNTTTTISKASMNLSFMDPN